MTTALIVEDHHDQAEMVARLLKLRDYESILAETGEKGLRLAREHVPDVVLLDLMLPDINGFDVCRRLRSDRSTMLTPIVMLTALGDSENRMHGFRVGANAYVSKPYGIEDLFHAVAAARAWRAGMDEEKMQGEIQVELNSEIAFLQELNDFLMNLCKSTPFSNEQMFQLRQAFLEMSQNAIEWGNRHHVEKLVHIRYRLFEDRVEIVVRDQGSGFNPGQIPHAASDDDPVSHLDVREELGIRTGGYGLMISKGMVDELRYNEQGNEVTLIKRYSPPPSPGSEPVVEAPSPHE
jgi:DNA-binding response OmpR family regulator